MANFYAKLKQSVENCDIFYLDSLSYIKQFVSSKQNAHNDSGKIILFCKEVSSSVYNWDQNVDFMISILFFQLFLLWKG